FADGGDDGGEVVVDEDHLRRLLRHVGAGDSHGDADVGALERWGVIHAVAGHAHDVAVGLECVDDAQLVLWGDAGEHRRLAYGAAERFVVELLDLHAGDRRGASRGDAEVGGDPSGGGRVVAGDHHHAHAGTVRLGDRDASLGARWVDDADDPGEDEIVRDLLGGVGRDIAIECQIRHREGPERVAGQPVDVGKDFTASAVVERPGVVADALVRAAREEDVGGALGDDDHAIVEFGIDL